MEEDKILDEDLLEKDPEMCDCGECHECIENEGKCTCGDCDMCTSESELEDEISDSYDDLEPEDLI